MLIQYISIVFSINVLENKWGICFKPKPLINFFSIFSCCTRSGDQPQEDLTKFLNPIPFGPTTKFYELNMKFL